MRRSLFCTFRLFSNFTATAGNYVWVSFAVELDLPRAGVPAMSAGGRCETSISGLSGQVAERCRSKTIACPSGPALVFGSDQDACTSPTTAPNTHSGSFFFHFDFLSADGLPDPTEFTTPFEQLHLQHLSFTDTFIQRILGFRNELRIPKVRRDYSPRYWRNWCVKLKIALPYRHRGTANTLKKSKGRWQRSNNRPPKPSTWRPRPQNTGTV
jgi:hypothetical protein